MTINNVYNELGSFLLGLVQNEKWEKVALHLNIQPKALGMVGKLHNHGKILSIRARLSDDLDSKVIWLHRITTEGGHNKWNKAVFTVSPDKKFDMEFIWDQEWQNEVNHNNLKETEKDSNYTPPKWYWDK